MTIKVKQVNGDSVIIRDVIKIEKELPAHEKYFQKVADMNALLYQASDQIKKLVKELINDGVDVFTGRNNTPYRCYIKDNEVYIQNMETYQTKNLEEYPVLSQKKILNYLFVTLN